MKVKSDIQSNDPPSELKNLTKEATTFFGKKDEDGIQVTLKYSDDTQETWDVNLANLILTLVENATRTKPFPKEKYADSDVFFWGESGGFDIAFVEETGWFVIESEDELKGENVVAKFNSENAIIRVGDKIPSYIGDGGVFNSNGKNAVVVPIVSANRLSDTTGA